MISYIFSSIYIIYYFSKDDRDYKVLVRELMNQGASEDEIQTMFDNLIEEEVKLITYINICIPAV